MKGIDISEWQSGLNLSRIKESGYDFVILRAGYTGYGSTRVKDKDSEFEGFYEQAKRNNIPVGAYWFSCADSAEQGRAEAEFMYNKCLKKKKFEYPIYIDVEDEHWQASDKKGVTDAIIAFCDYLEDKGYYVGVYASLYWFDAWIETERLSKYTKWVACWDKTKPDFEYNAFDMWQYTSDANVQGMRIDADESFIDFPAIIKKGGFNGYTTNTSSSTEKPLEKPQKEAYSGSYPNIPPRGYYLQGDGYEEYEDYDLSIKNIQKFLNWAINAGLEVDGCYGPKTEKAVADFQKKAGIKVDGSYGYETLEAAKKFRK